MRESGRASEMAECPSVGSVAACRGDSGGHRGQGIKKPANLINGESENVGGSSECGELASDSCSIKATWR